MVAERVIQVSVTNALRTVLHADRLPHLSMRT